MPRLAELLDLRFGQGCAVISDMAIPFAHALLRGRRVAIVDDLVNVGSTLAHAKRSVLACGAADVRLYALGQRDTTSLSERVDCVFAAPLTPTEYTALVTSVADHLLQLNKPYDLEFPTLRCRLSPFCRSTAVLLARLRALFGAACVHDLTVQPGPSNLARFGVDLDSDDGGNYKLRLYVDEHERICNLVPFAIPADLSKPPAPSSPVAQALLDALEGALDDAPPSAGLWENAEARCRARMFVRSLDLGLAVGQRLSDVVQQPDQPFLLDDARTLFGPIVEDALLSPNSSIFADQRAPKHGLRHSTQEPSAFWDHVLAKPEDGLLERVRAHLPPHADVVQVFMTMFDTLANLLGTADHEKYVLNWPYSREQIAEHPYLRLRVGPTFVDLVRLYQLTCPAAGSDVPAARHVVSAALDYLIDVGAVVPTFANYAGVLHRIYRKGERDPRDCAIDRAMYAWEALGRPLSLTRAAKVMATLAFSSELEEVTFPQTLERGNVASLQTTCLDTTAETVVRYARAIGRLQSIVGGGSGE